MNACDIGWMCAECGNYVAVYYKGHAIQPGEALNTEWNAALYKRADPVGKDTMLLRCGTRKDFLIVRLIQVAAKNEDSRLLSVRQGEQGAGLYFDKRRKKYLGFVVWSADSDHAVLRQIYIVPDERRKGLASELVSFWVEHYADKVSNKFGIEDPNGKAQQLHIKLGHATLEGDSVRGVKCFFVSGM
jgi:GNAT superfamily N-acetyltransferase